jgi:hypothetical protein
MTNWHPHTVRGFMSAVIRKKLNLALRSEKIDGEPSIKSDGPQGLSAGKPPALNGAILYAPPQNSPVTSTIEGEPAGPITCVPGSFW